MATKKTVKKSNKETILEKKSDDTKTKKEKNIKESEVLDSAEEQYFTISLDTFLYNSGIVGFIKVLEAAGAKEGDSIDNKKDYFIDRQDLYASKEFLLNPKTDLAQGYIDAVCEKFEDKTSIFNTLQNIDNLIETKEIDAKILSEKLESITTSFSAASINTGCETLKAVNIEVNIQENIEKIKKFKNDLDKEIKKYSKKEIDNDLKKKVEKYILKYTDLNDIKKYLKNISLDFKNKKLRQTLLMKNIIYTKIRLFWDNKSFLLPANSKNDIKDEFIKSFETPLKENKNISKKQKYNCITCSASASKDIDTTFLFEVGVDTNRKKSSFWNQNPDSFICPLCNFIYSCSPLGFIDIGGTMIFINRNESIESIVSMNKGIELENEGKNFKLYNTIIERALSIKTKELNSIQVITRNKKHYSLNVIGKDILEIIKIRKKELGYISKVSIKISAEEYINVFEECLHNIFNNINQWNLIFKIFKYDKNISSYSFIFSILIIQITQEHIFHKEENVDNNIKIAYVACKSGGEMRRVIIGAKPDKSLSDNENKEADNKLRGLVYQLVNSVHTSNRDLFLSNITRLYTAMNMTIPSIFINAFKNDVDFKEVGYAYILGLKGAYGSNKQDINNN